MAQAVAIKANILIGGIFTPAQLKQPSRSFKFSSAHGEPGAHQGGTLGLPAIGHTGQAAWPAAAQSGEQKGFRLIVLVLGQPERIASGDGGKKSLIAGGASGTFDAFTLRIYRHIDHGQRHVHTHTHSSAVRFKRLRCCL